MAEEEEKNEQGKQPVTEAPAEAETAATPTAARAAPAPAAESAPEPLSPKERRRRKRSTHKGGKADQLSDEARVEARIAERKRKAEARRRYRQGRGGKRLAAEKARRGDGTPPADREPGTGKMQQGIVVSSKADKTITVRVASAHRHPAYEKIIRRGKMLHAHDERNEAGPGDTVRLIETRPMSRTKHWRLTEIVEKAR